MLGTIKAGQTLNTTSGEYDSYSSSWFNVLKDADLDKLVYEYASANDQDWYFCDGNFLQSLVERGILSNMKADSFISFGSYPEVNSISTPEGDFDAEGFYLDKNQAPASLGTFESKFHIQV